MTAIVLNPNVFAFANAFVLSPQQVTPVIDLQLIPDLFKRGSPSSLFLPVFANFCPCTPSV